MKKATMKCAVCCRRLYDNPEYGVAKLFFLANQIIIADDQLSKHVEILPGRRKLHESCGNFVGATVITEDKLWERDK